MPTIAVIIPTYGHFEYACGAAVTAMCKTKADAKVLVVDDATPGVRNEDDLRFRLAMAELGRHDLSRVTFFRFRENGGLTRSWNFGLQWARIHCCDYACVTNSDVRFAEGWDEPLRSALEEFHLVGPVTNAPGTEERQYVGHYTDRYVRADPAHGIDETARDLGSRQVGVEEGPINGFCMLARTATWWEHAYDADHVFRPRNDVNSRGMPNPTPLMTLNEYELQRRWRDAGLRVGFCPASYVFHYRAVTRGDAHRRGDWARLP